MLVEADGAAAVGRSRHGGSPPAVPAPQDRKSAAFLVLVVSNKYKYSV